MNHQIWLGMLSAAGFFLGSSTVMARPLPYVFTASPQGIHIAQNSELTDELTDPEWQEVEPAFIDIANIQREGDLVIFDTVDFEAGYTRLEGNCSTNQVRTLRDGYFLSMTTVSYRDFSDSSNHEFADPSPLQQQLLDIACATEVRESGM